MAQKEILYLPQEDNTWIFGMVDNNSEDSGDCENGELWAVVDSRGAFIGAYTKSEEEDTSKALLKLLEDCMTLPLCWKPRRPKYISFRDPSHRVPLDVEKYNITSLEFSHMKPSHNHADLNCTIVQPSMQSCSVCRRRGTLPLFFTCGKCHAVYYCSTTCQQEDIQSLSAMQGHSQWCDKMSGYVKETDALADLPFTFASTTTAAHFDERSYKDFQQQLGVYGKGLWKREAPCPQELHLPDFGEILNQDFDDKRKFVNTFVLDDLSNLCTEDDSKDVAGNPPNEPLQNWKDYFEWRGLSLESPIGILMQWPLTVYHILMNLMKNDYPDQLIFLQNEETLVIHIIGVEKEMDIIPVFYELEKLIPNKQFEILMVGNEICRQVCKKSITYNKMKITFAKGLYHLINHQRPHVVIGFNAGIGAYPSWSGTLRYLAETGTPAYFTDYCHYSCECALFPMQGGNLGDISNIRINPFRSPVRKYSEGTTFPWFSNGFIFCLKYTTAANTCSSGLINSSRQVDSV